MTSRILRTFRDVLQNSFWMTIPLIISRDWYNWIFSFNDAIWNQWYYVFVKNLRDPSKSFNVMDFVEFCSGSTRSSTFLKLKQRMSKLNSVKHFYFNRLPHLWNSLPSMDPKDPLNATKQKLRQCLWNHFLVHFDPENPCSFHYVCPCRKCSLLPVTNKFKASVL